ncbi:MAG: glycosyl hydrolase-related protein, partial [Candidatus Hodarchaeota archaeon]
IVNPSKDDSRENEAIGLKTTDNSAENDVIKLEINENGTFKLTDKVNNAVYDDLNSFHDISDVGDSWLFRPLPGDIPITSNACDAEIKKVIDTGFVASFQVDISFDVPTSVNFDSRTRTDGNSTLNISSIVTIHAGDCPRVDVKVKYENTAKDHRLSVVFPTRFEAKSYQVDGHFGLTTRSTKLPDGTGWKKPPQEQGPQHRLVTISSDAGDKGLLIANKDLPECEATIEEDGTVELGLTLLRCIGRWGVHMGEGSPITVDITQCIGPQEHEYSIIPHQGEIFPRAYKEAMQFRYPVYVVYKEAHNKYQGYFPNIEKPEAFLPMSFSFFKLSNPKLALSTIKKAERSDDTIVRVYNLSKTENTEGTLETSLDVKKVVLVNLNEEELDDTTVQVEHSIHSIKLNVPPAKIVTLKLSVD